MLHSKTCKILRSPLLLDSPSIRPFLLHAWQMTKRQQKVNEDASHLGEPNSNNQDRSGGLWPISDHCSHPSSFLSMCWGAWRCRNVCRRWKGWVPSCSHSMDSCTLSVWPCCCSNFLAGWQHRRHDHDLGDQTKTVGAYVSSEVLICVHCLMLNVWVSAQIQAVLPVQS